MKMDAEVKARIVAIKHNYDEASKSRTVTPVLAFKVREDEAKALLGSQFYDDVFDGMGEEEVEADEGQGDIEGEAAETKMVTTFRWADPLKLNAVWQQHNIRICGKKYVVIPEGCVVRAVEEEAAVMVHVELSLNGNNPEFQGALATAYKELISVKFEATQLAVPGTEGEAPVRKRGKRNWGNNAPRAAGEEA